MGKKTDGTNGYRGVKKFLPFISGALTIILLAFFYFAITPLITTSVEVVILAILCILLGVLIVIISHMGTLIPNLDRKSESVANFIAGVNCVVLIIIIIVAYRALTDVVTFSYIPISTTLATVSVFLFFSSGIVGR
ncbi:MAG: hypothetical protein WC974_06665 [Thermoplasmata archaeon]